MAVELFADALASTTVAASKTAPASGTVETWTVASSTGFPAAATGVSQFRIQEDDATKQSEVILVTNVSGTTWTVTRGAESTTPVTHPAGFTIVPTLTAGVMANLLQLDGTQSVAGSKTFSALTTIALASPGVHLSVDAPTGQNTDIQRWRVNGTSVATLKQDGSAVLGIPNSTSGVLIGGGSGGTSFAAIMANTIANALEVQGPWGGSTGALRLGNATGGVSFFGPLDIQQDTNVQAQNVIDFINGTYGRTAKIGGLNGHTFLNHSSGTGTGVVDMNNAKAANYVLRLQHPTSPSGAYIQFGISGGADVASVSAAGIFSGPAVAAAGLTGATSGARLVGGTASGAPVSGTFAARDFITTADGHIFVYTGSAWADAGASAGVSSLTGTAGQIGVSASSGAVTLTNLGALLTANTFTADQVLSKTAPKWSFSDGTDTAVIGLATAAGNISAFSSARDLVLAGAQRVFTPLPFSANGAISSAAGIAGTTGIFSGDITANGSSVVLKDDASPVASASGQIGLYSTGGRGKLVDSAGGTWDLDSERTTRLAGDVTTTTVATPPTVTTGLSDVLTAGTYSIEWEGGWRSSVNTAGLRLTVTFSGTQTAISYGGSIQNTATGNGTNTVQYTANSPSINSGSAAAASIDYPFRLYGTIVVTVSGTVDLKFGPTSAATTTLRAGSTLKVKRIG